MSISTLSIDEILKEIQSLKVLVIGDLMLDRYCYGNVTRISPEAPVPIINVESKEERLGGAANVALNCSAFGAQVAIAGIIGDDDAGNVIKELLATENIDNSLLLAEPQRATTTKTRIISRHQQLLRMDDEHIEDVQVSTEHAFIDKVLKYIQIQKPAVVIFEDYDKGTFNQNIIEKIMKHCQDVGCITTVDPKFKNFFYYKGATIFKPNLQEAQDAFKLKPEKNKLELVETYANKIEESLQPQITFITLSELGVYIKEGEKTHILPAKKRKIADVSGAGDTVIATASLVYAVTKNAYQAAQYANIAGGMVCEYVGVVPLNVEDWKKEIQNI